MSKTLRILIAALTVSPMFYIFFFIVVFMSAAVGQVPPPFEFLVPLHLLTMMTMFGLLIFYAVHAAKNPSFTKEWRIIWVLLLIHAGPFAMAAYWYQHIWNTQDPLTEAGALSGAAV